MRAETITIPMKDGPTNPKGKIAMLNDNPERGEAINMTINDSPPVGAQVPIEAIEAWRSGVAADRRLNAIAKVVAFRLFLDDADPGSTYEEIGAATGCGRRTAIRAVALLIDRGWIVKHTCTKGAANSYGMAMRAVAS
jgi:hypothetical protein